MAASPRISVIIPCHNSGLTIGPCLEAAFASTYDNFEVIVVDDFSADGSAAIVKEYGCPLVSLHRHAGASAARNAGALHSSGDILFFIDADCLLRKETLAVVAETMRHDTQTIFGGTYTAIAADDTFFSTFQSLFVHHAETKYAEPDYVATHAMAISAEVFRRSGGFPEEFMPILEDVEFSHRLRRAGYRLSMNPRILVQHIFNFTLMRSLKNAFRKSLYWTVYSLANRDIHRDSGTASVGLKATVLAWFLNFGLATMAVITGETGWLLPVPAIYFGSLLLNRGFLSLVYRHKGIMYSLLAMIYYTLIYPFAVGAGGLAGLLRYLAGYGPSLRGTAAKGISQ